MKRLHFILVATVIQSLSPEVGWSEVPDEPREAGARNLIQAADKQRSQCYLVRKAERVVDCMSLFDGQKASLLKLLVLYKKEEATSDYGGKFDLLTDEERLMFDITQRTANALRSQYIPWSDGDFHSSPYNASNLSLKSTLVPFGKSHCPSSDTDHGLCTKSWDDFERTIQDAIDLADKIDHLGSAREITPYLDAVVDEARIQVKIAETRARLIVQYLAPTPSK